MTYGDLQTRMEEYRTEVARSDATSEHRRMYATKMCILNHIMITWRNGGKRAALLKLRKLDTNHD